MSGSPVRRVRGAGAHLCLWPTGYNSSEFSTLRCLRALVRLLEAAGYDLKVVKVGHHRTLEDILAEQRRGEDAP